MITAVVFMLFLGLIVFGPKKTVEIAQTIGRLLAQVRHASGQFQSQIEQEVCTQERSYVESINQSTTPSPTEMPFRPASNSENVKTDAHSLHPTRDTVETNISETIVR